MKEKLKKFTLTILAVIMAFNGIICFDRGYVVQAADAGTTVNEQDLEDEFNQMDDSSQNWGNDLADVLLGIVLYIPKAMAYAIVGTVRLIVWLISAIDQNSSAGSSATSIESILFNGYKITSIDFFSGIGGTSTMGKLKQNVATWYYSMRNIAIVILLGILLYVGIRMAISTVAEEEAKYKKMFKDWVVSLVLLFVLHYIMIFTIEMNDVLVDLIGTSRPGGTALSTAMETIAGKVWDVRFTVGVGALCVYAILVGMTVIYLFMYIKRMLTVGFLIIIAPLITITYSIDKMGDGRSQALNRRQAVLSAPLSCLRAGKRFLKADTASANRAHSSDPLPGQLPFSAAIFRWLRQIPCGRSDLSPHSPCRAPRRAAAASRT